MFCLLLLLFPIPPCKLISRDLTRRNRSFIGFPLDRLQCSYTWGKAGSWVRAPLGQCAYDIGWTVRGVLVGGVSTCRCLDDFALCHAWCDRKTSRWPLTARERPKNLAVPMIDDTSFLRWWRWVQVPCRNYMDRARLCACFWWMMALLGLPYLELHRSGRCAWMTIEEDVLSLMWCCCSLLWTPGGRN